MLCPTDNEIAEYLHGMISDAEGSQIEEHISGCENCEQKAIRLDASGDSLLRHLRLKPTPVDLGKDWNSCTAALKKIPSQIKESMPPADAVSLRSALQPEALYHYQLGRQLGRGGMGVVYESWHPQLHRKVAIKILSASRAADAPSIARFQREMRMAGGLDHAGIVRAVDAGVWQGTYYMVMEYVDGIDLSKLVQHCGPLSPTEAMQIVAQAAQALEYAHGQQVIHRDIKPSNLMLGRDGTVKILDFGLARLEHGGLTNHDATTAGRLVGTLDYLAPEQATGGSAIDARADVYALGATLFKLLTGRPPHGSSQDRPILQHLQKLTTEDAESPRAFRDDVTEELCDLISRMLSRDPNQRPSSAAGVLALLNSLMADGTPDTGCGLDELAAQALIKLDIQAESLPEEINLPPNSVQGIASLPVTDPDIKNFAAPASKDLVAPTAAWPRFLGALALLLIGLAGGLAGVTLWINTGDAKIRIESEVDDVRLQLASDGKVVNEIEVKTGQTESIVRVGKYELRVAGSTDNVRVSDKEILLQRNDNRVVAIIREQPRAELKTKLPTAGLSNTEALAQEIKRLEQKIDQLESAANEITPDVTVGGSAIASLRESSIPSGHADATNKGRTYSQWRELVLTETDPSTIVDAIDSLEQLSWPDQKLDVLSLLAHIAKVNETRAAEAPVVDAYVRWIGAPKNVRRVDAKQAEHFFDQVFQGPPPEWGNVLSAIEGAIESLAKEDYTRKPIIQLATSEGTPACKRALMAILLKIEFDQQALIAICRANIEPTATRETRALAAYVLYGELRQADDFVKTSLENDDAMLNKVLVYLMFDQQNHQFPDQLGSATGRLILGGPSEVANQLTMEVERLIFRAQPSQDFRGTDTCLFLETLGASIVDAWERGSETEVERSTYVVRSLAASDLMMPVTRRKASQHLHRQLIRQLNRRDKETEQEPIEANDSAGLASSIYDTSSVLATLDDESPKELLDFPMQASGPIRQEFSKWCKSSKPGESLFESGGVRWFRDYPVEFGRAVALKIAERGPIIRGPQRSNRGRDDFAEAIPSWLAFSALDQDLNEHQTANYFHSVLAHYGKNEKRSHRLIFTKADARRLFEIANEHPSKQIQSIALNMAQSLGFDQQRIQKRAMESMGEMISGGPKAADGFDATMLLESIAGCEDVSSRLDRRELLEAINMVTATPKTIFFQDMSTRAIVAALEIARAYKLSPTKVVAARIGLGFPVVSKTGQSISTTQMFGHNLIRNRTSQPRNDPQDEAHVWAKLGPRVPEAVLRETLRLVGAVQEPNEEFRGRLVTMETNLNKFPPQPATEEPRRLLSKAMAAVQDKQ